MYKIIEETVGDKGTFKAIRSSGLSHNDAIHDNDLVSHQFGHLVLTPVSHACVSSSCILEKGYTHFLKLSFEIEWRQRFTQSRKLKLTAMSYSFS